MRAKVRPGLMRREGLIVLRVLLIAALCLQSFLVQTHIHGVPLRAASGPDVSVSAPHGSKAPLDVDHCPLCQEFVHAGAYVMPASLAALPPTAVIGVVRLFTAPLFASKPHSHNWMGRAPPRA